MIELKKCRDKIDGIDREILKLFEERMHVVRDVADIKKQMESAYATLLGRGS